MATFGWTGIIGGSAGSVAADKIWYTGTFTCPSNGTANSIIIQYGCIGATVGKAAIYNGDKTGPITNGVTAETTLPDTGLAQQEITLLFNAPKPSVIGGTSYIIALWIDDGRAPFYIAQTGYTTWRDDETYGGSWPATLATDSTNANVVEMMYCSYTPLGGGAKPWDEASPDVLSYYGFNLR